MCVCVFQNSLHQYKFLIKLFQSFKWSKFTADRNERLVSWVCTLTLPIIPLFPQVNDMVACLVRGSEGEDNWILAEVVSYNPATNKYEVDDIDEEQKERHTLSRRRVYPLPLMRANPEVNPEALYPKGSIGRFIFVLYLAPSVLGRIFVLRFWCG